jgi:outer membrane immunogenic protein
MLKILAASAVALGALVGAAEAAPVYNWTGFYVGGFAGGLSGHTTPASDTAEGPSGLDAGLTVSYAWQTQGNWVFTPFLALPISGEKGTYASGYITSKVDWSVAGGAKLGYAVDRWLPYAFVAALVAGGSADNGTTVEKATHTGVTFGVGVDYALNDRWSVGARYAHISVGAKDYFSVPVGFQGDSFAATFNFKLQ